MTKRVSRVLGTVVLALFAACSSPAATPETFEDLSAEDQALVRFESTWQCDVARYTYPDFDSIEAARMGLLADMGVADGAYSEFKKQLDTDAVMRRHVANVFSTDCA
jgi:hypothetical protein